MKKVTIIPKDLAKSGYNKPDIKYKTLIILFISLATHPSVFYFFLQFSPNVAPKVTISGKKIYLAKSGYKTNKRKRNSRNLITCYQNIGTYKQKYGDFIRKKKKS